MKVLVAYGSRHGGTEGIAEVIGEVFSDAGFETVVRSAEVVEAPENWDAVILGGAIYAWRWQRDARNFAFRHVDSLRQMPVWAFSSGPLDDSASTREIPPPWPVARIVERIGARGHATFGGRIAEEAPEAQKMEAGDWRDMERVRAWAREVAEALESASPPRVRPGIPSLRGVRGLAVALCLFTGLTATIGGADLAVSPAGGGWFGLDAQMLDGTPFSNFRIPGIFLLVIGASNTVAGFVERRGWYRSELYVLGGGLLLAGWILVQMWMLGTANWLQILYACIGVVTMAAGTWLAGARERLPEVAPDSDSESRRPPEATELERGT